MSRYDQVPSERVGYGLNEDRGGYRDDRYVRCSRCGFVLNKNRHVKGREGSRMGWGTDLSSQTFNSAYGLTTASITTVTVGIAKGTPMGALLSLTYAVNTTGSTVTITGSSYRIDPVVKMGCPFCGTLMYE
jgi:hypothetical protein